MNKKLKEILEFYGDKKASFMTKGKYIELYDLRYIKDLAKYEINELESKRKDDFAKIVNIVARMKKDYINELEKENTDLCQQVVGKNIIINKLEKENEGLKVHLKEATECNACDIDGNPIKLGFS